MTELKLDDFQEASEYLKGKINRTPLYRSSTLGKLFGCELYLKLENFQKTGSFKARGALYRMSKLTPEEKKRGVITASSGNHAQGVAYAASFNGIKAKIVMPETSVPAKINAVQNYGAEVVLYGNDYSDAKLKADEIARMDDSVFIEAFNDENVITGQGTVGLEIIEDLPDVDIIVVPVGGGGLISGISMASRLMKPSVKIIGVESEMSDSMRLSVQEGRVVPHTNGNSIADGISVKYPGEITLSIVSKYVDDIVTVSDESIAHAIYVLLERNKIVVEPSGAASLAAIMDGKVDVKGKKVVCILSGGNINLLLLSKIIFKSMELESKLVRLEFRIPDRPGTLFRISSAISEVGGNVFHAEVDNLARNTPVGFQTVKFSVNIRGEDHLAQLIEKIGKLGYSYEIVS